MARQPGFWDFADRLAELSAHGDPLEKLNATVDLELDTRINLAVCRDLCFTFAIALLE